MKNPIQIALLILLGANIAQAQQTFKCYEQVGKFAHGSKIAAVVNLTESEIIFTSLKGEAESAAWNLSEASVITTRAGEILRAGTFNIENTGTDRLAYYHYNRKKPLEQLALKCFGVK
jgi:hypothetical protein